MAVSPHSEGFTIYTFQTDAAGKATLPALVAYMEEAAGNHAAKLGLSIGRLHDEGVAWVLSRLQMAPEKLPGANERISVETWPVGVEGLQYRRDFIVRLEDGSVALRAISHWVVVTMATRKIGRVPAFIAAVALDNPNTAMADGKARLPAVREEGESCRFRARLADIDANGHVNNVRYMDWVIESAPETVRETRHLSRLELSFKAEAFHHDTVSARTCVFPEDPAEGESFAHSLVRIGDGRELVRACSLWRRTVPS